MSHMWHNPVSNNTSHANALRRAMCALTDAIGEGEPDNVRFFLEQARGYAYDARKAASRDMPCEIMAADYMTNFIADMTVVLRRQFAPATI